ncbi:hypothetical protein [Halarcobacter sp.]|nr:hypothetical protein [Halarcobacter sp.]
MSIYKLKLDANMQTSKKASFTNLSIYLGIILAAAVIFAFI